MYRLAHLPPCPYCEAPSSDHEAAPDNEAAPNHCEACYGTGRYLERALLELDYDEMVFKASPNHYGVRR